MNLENQIKLGIKKAYINTLTDISAIREEAKKASLRLLQEKNLLIKENPFLEKKEENIEKAEDVTLSMEFSFLLASINKDIDSINSVEELKNCIGQIHEQILMLEEIKLDYFNKDKTNEKTDVY